MTGPLNPGRGPPAGVQGRGGPAVLQGGRRRAWPSQPGRGPAAAAGLLPQCERGLAGTSRPAGGLHQWQDQTLSSHNQQVVSTTIQQWHFGTWLFDNRQSLE